MPAVLIASDKFKWPLTAAHVAEAAAEGAPGAAGCARVDSVRLVEQTAAEATAA